MVQLTEGAITQILEEGMPEGSQPVLQILGNKRIPGGSNERFRLIVSDGTVYHTFAMLATQLNDLVTEGQLDNHTVIRVNRHICNNVKAQSNDNKKVIIILDVSVLNPGVDVGATLGNPTQYVPNPNYVPTTNNTENKPPADYNGAGNNGNDYNAKPSAAYGGLAEKSSLLSGPTITPKPAATNNFAANNRVAAVGQEDTHPISSLSPYQNKWTIRARVTNKSDIRTWNNARGTGKLFSMDLIDDGGEIRATAFNEQVDKFENIIEVGKVYYISRGQIKTANKNFSKLNNDYEMTFGNETTVTPCDDDSSTPQMSFDFCRIDELNKVENNGNADVIGICKSSGACTEITTKAGKQLIKREIELVDSTCTGVTLTLWGTQAENFSANNNPVIAIKGARVSDFSGRSISSSFSSTLQINPDIDAAHSLRGWYDSQGQNAVINTISQRGAGAGGNMASQVMSIGMAKSKQLGSTQADYYSTTATVVMARKENCLYQACAEPECNKKVIDQNNGSFRCEKCSKDSPNFKWRLMLTMSIADCSDSTWVTCFQESAELLLGQPAAEIARMREQDENEFNQLFQDCNFVPFTFNLRVKTESFNDESRLKTVVSKCSRVSLIDHNKKLLEDIKAYQNNQ